MLANVAMYPEAGDCLVWLANPPTRTVTVFMPDCGPVVLGEGDDLDGGKLLPGFRVAIAELFA